MNQSEHNPDNLTPEQYGAPEWRLLGPDELIQVGDEWLRPWDDKWVPDVSVGKTAADENTQCLTYRRRVFVPTEPAPTTESVSIGSKSVEAPYGEKLLPCPFCGMPPISGNVSGEDPSGESYGYWAIECRKCSNQQYAERFCGVHGESKEDATRHWNTRADSSELATLRLAEVERERDEAIHERKACHELYDEILELCGYGKNQSYPGIIGAVQNLKNAFETGNDALKMAEMERDAARAEVERLKASLARRLPRIGAWDNDCLLCGAKTDCGDIPHTNDCPFVTAALTTPQP